MELISAVQSKNARQLLSWHQEDLADNAKVCVQTVRNLEKGEAVLPSTIEKIRCTFEVSGIEFLEGDGVRRRITWCSIYNGSDNCDKLFNDISNSLKQHGGEVLAYISDYEVMVKKSGTPRRNILERLNALCESGDVRCVINESSVRSDFMPSFAYRAVPTSFVPIRKSIFVFGKKYADVLWDASGRFYVVVVDAEATAQSYRQDINDLWQKSVTIERANKLPKRHVESAHIALYK